MEELSKDESWIIIENLIVQYQEWEEKVECEDELEEEERNEAKDLKKKFEDLLNKISPNWLDADSCEDVECYKINIIK